MEHQYIFWKTRTGCLAALLSFPVATVVVITLLLWLPQNTWLQIAVALVCYSPAVWVSFRIDRSALGRRKRSGPEI